MYEKGLVYVMVHIRELDGIDESYIQPIADLHKLAFPCFFLTQLGAPFLCTLYRGYMEDKASGIIVAEDGGELVGFIAYSKDYPSFYKGLIKNHILRFGLLSAVAVIHHPSFCKRLLSAFRKSDSVMKSERYVELSSICVDPARKNAGIGTALVAYLKEIVDYQLYAYINLETDAVDNDSVNAFYIKNGFQLARRFSTAEGRRMNEYRYAPGEKQ